MPPVTVSVEATWRMSRVEFLAPWSPTGMIQGYGEVLLQEPSSPSKGADIFHTPMMALAEEGKKTYGTMPGAPVSRPINTVLEEKVDVDGQTISFETVMQALSQFMSQWRAEDAAKPPPAAYMPPPPPEPSPVQHMTPPPSPELAPEPTPPEGEDVPETDRLKREK